MKWIIASDVHGSAFWCRKLIEFFEKEKADRLFLLGDILYHGPRNDLPSEYSPKKVIEYLNPLKNRILCVKGNCDTEVDQMVLDFPILADYAVFSDWGKNIYATHGHKINNNSLPPINSGEILLCGHTHVPALEFYDTHIYVNPGSVSIPKENSPHSCIVFDNGKMEWVDIETGERYKKYLFE